MHVSQRHLAEEKRATTIFRIPAKIKPIELQPIWHSNRPNFRHAHANALNILAEAAVHGEMYDAHEDHVILPNSYEPIICNTCDWRIVPTSRLWSDGFQT